MPDLTKLPLPEFTGGMPYHWTYDNLPLKVLADRDYIINGEVDYQSKVLSDAAGTQGNVANRLNQSIDEDGNLKDTAIDEALHNIAEHSNGTKTVESDELSYYVDTLGYSTVTNPVSFVRMLEVERAKLSLISDQANNLNINVDDTPYTSGTINLVSSDTVQWEIDIDTIKPVLAISTNFIRRHYYDQETTSDEDNYINYSTPVPYVEGSLRVYINGIRLSSEVSVYYPVWPAAESWSLNKFTSDASAGTFVLDNAITEDDVIRIDFDVE